MEPVKKKRRRRERRKHPRYNVKDGAFAVLMPGYSKIGRIINISMGGLLFQYANGESYQKMPYELEIIASKNDFSLDKIPVKIVSEFTLTNEPRLRSAVVKQRGIRFRKLNPNHKYNLEYFISNYTTGPVPAR